MSIIDYDQLSRSELLEIMKEIPSELKKREKTTRKLLLDQMQKMAEDEGFSLDEIVDGKKTKSSKKAAAKYKDPESATTWSGRGRKPLWVIAALESGKTLQDLEIN